MVEGIDTEQVSLQAQQLADEIKAVEHQLNVGHVVGVVNE
jgi:hypothetical protein